jgi:hypothetical protein
MGFLIEAKPGYSLCSPMIIACIMYPIDPLYPYIEAH